MVKRDCKRLPIDRGEDAGGCTQENADAGGQVSRTTPGAPLTPARPSSGPLPRLACPLCPSQKAFCGVPSKLAQHQRGSHPGRGKDLLSSVNEQLFHRYEVCSICGNLETNMSRHQNMCRRRTPLTTQDPLKPSANTQAPVTRRPPPSTGTGPNAPDSGTNTEPLLPWSLEDVGEALDRVPIAELSVLSFSTAKHIRPEHRRPFGKYLGHAIKLLMQAHSRTRDRGQTGSSQAERPAGPSQAARPSEADKARLERAVKLLHVTPAMLQSVDGRLSRQHCYELFAAGEIGRMLEWLLSFAKQGTAHTGQADAASKRARAEVQVVPMG